MAMLNWKISIVLKQLLIPGIFSISTGALTSTTKLGIPLKHLKLERYTNLNG